MPRSVSTPARRRRSASHRRQLLCGLLAWALLTPPELPAAGQPSAPATLFRENFDNLNSWRTWEFTRIKRVSRYEVQEEAGNFVLRLEAERSAAGLILTRNFPVRKNLRLRWRVEVYPRVIDPRRRTGDDFAIRIYVIFEQDAARAGWLERWALRDAPFRSEGILPERSLAYVSTRISGLPEFYPNPYTNRVVVLPILTDDDAIGAWQEISVDPVADYRRAFGKEPPAYFRFALMSDADDSRSRALAWLDFIEVRRE